MPNRKNKVLKVTGKVQGVYFRVSTLQVANEIGVCGFVMNCDDGSVYIEAEGTEEQLNRLIKWCQTGPPYAKVEHVWVSEKERENYQGFEVRR